MKKGILMGVCLLIACTGVMADNVFPPIWHGEWSTTFQYWEFNTDEGLNNDMLQPDGPGLLNEGQGIEGVPYADQGGSPGYLPGTHVNVNPDPQVWYPTDPLYGSGREGIFPLSGSIDVFVENHDALNEYKWVYVQITWAQEVLGDDSVPAILNTDPAADPNWPVTMTDEFDHGDGWKTSLYEWRIYPNPPLETFTIGFDGKGIMVDQLVIDTWCIPEPTSIAMIGIVCGLGVFIRRRVTN